MIDGFISHSSADRSLAMRLEKALEANGFSLWHDNSEIRLGVLLGKELQAAIRDARVLLLLWSGDAAASRWVATEWLTAYHEDRFIVPCSLDGTPLPQCLSTSVYLRVRRVTASVVEQLSRALREAPSGHNELAPAMGAQGPELASAIGRIATEQSDILEILATGNLAKARTRQTRLDADVDDALHAWPLDPVLVNLAGYHLKNAYMLKFWDAIQAGRGPRDPLLERSERRFLETLALDPTDPSSLNGLANIFFFRRDLDAAEFFHGAAIAAAKRRGFSYPAAEDDIAMVRRFKPA